MRNLAPTPPQVRVQHRERHTVDLTEARLRKLERRTGILWTLLMLALIIGAIHATAFVLNIVADAKQKTTRR